MIQLGYTVVEDRKNCHKATKKWLDGVYKTTF